jgi:hypothetical protein
VPSDIWNEGYYFSRCACCDREMIGRGGYWQPVPRGYRVVWKPRTAAAIIWQPVPKARDASRLSEMLLAA